MKTKTAEKKNLRQKVKNTSTSNSRVNGVHNIASSKMILKNEKYAELFFSACSYYLRQFSLFTTYQRYSSSNSATINAKLLK